MFENAIAYIILGALWAPSLTQVIKAPKVLRCFINNKWDLSKACDVNIAFFKWPSFSIEKRKPGLVQLFLLSGYFYAFIYFII